MRCEGERERGTFVNTVVNTTTDVTNNVVGNGGRGGTRRGTRTRTRTTRSRGSTLRGTRTLADTCTGRSCINRCGSGLALGYNNEVQHGTNFNARFTSTLPNLNDLTDSVAKIRKLNRLNATVNRNVSAGRRVGRGGHVTRRTRRHGRLRTNRRRLGVASSGVAGPVAVCRHSDFVGGCGYNKHEGT